MSPTTPKSPLKRSHNSEFLERNRFGHRAGLYPGVARSAMLASPFAAVVQRRVDYDSFRLEADSLPVRLARQAIERNGATPQSAISNGGVDANWLVKHGIPTVTLGCGQRDVHTSQESLDIPDFLAACDIARSVIEHAS
ncbi:MAG: M20/M25/M40 family metallo-hydrolase [Pirellulaceae bacterium]